MRFIKKFYSFVSEELISGTGGKSFVKVEKGKQKMNFDKADINIFTTIFNSDPLKLKEFIQYNLRDRNVENIRFISGGSIGLSFLWKDKVLKFTTDLSEKSGVEKMLKLAPGNSTLPGFAKYYWIEEIDLPESVWIKDRREMDWQDELKIKNQRDRLKNPQGKVLLSPESADIRKSVKKVKKAYIICLEKLTMLDETQMDIAWAISMLYEKNYFKREEPLEKTINKMNKFFEWAISNETDYKEEEYLKSGINMEYVFLRPTDFFMSERLPGINKHTLFSDRGLQRRWIDFGQERFSKFSEQLANIYKRGFELGIPTQDIHPGNLGFRENSTELVAFDCM